MTGLAASARTVLIAAALSLLALGCTSGEDEVAGVGSGVSTEVSVDAAENDSILQVERGAEVAQTNGAEPAEANGSPGSSTDDGDEAVEEPVGSDGADTSGGESDEQEVASLPSSASTTLPSSTPTSTSSGGGGVQSTTTLGSEESPSPEDVGDPDPGQPGDGILLAVLIIAANGDIDAAVEQGLVTVDDVEAALAAIAEGNLDEYIPEG